MGVWKIGIIAYLYWKFIDMCSNPAVFIFLIFCALQTRAQNFVKEILREKIPVVYTGKPIDAYEFKDALGLHIYLVTKIVKENNITICGFGYTQDNGIFMQDWKMTDFSGDNILLYYHYTTITDIDRDGIMESIFVYEVDPDNGMGSTFKVLLYYKNKKYALRVHIPKLDEDEYKETYDQSFATLPPSIRKYVNDYWNNVARHEHLRGTKWYEIPNK